MPYLIDAFRHHRAVKIFLPVGAFFKKKREKLNIEAMPLYLFVFRFLS